MTYCVMHSKHDAGVKTRVGHAVAPNARILYIRKYMHICANMCQCGLEKKGAWPTLVKTDCNSADLLLSIALSFCHE